MAAKIFFMPHITLAALESGLAGILNSPTNEGKLELIVRRPVKGTREVLGEGNLTLEEGLSGDCWIRHEPDPEMQINIMNSRAISLIAGEREMWQLAGDQLYIDMDLSEANLPPGTRLQIGAAILEITAIPHTGCGKFAKRFGVDAAKFVNSRRGRELRLRGLNARVLQPGMIRKGDIVRKVLSSSDQRS